ncbi:condensation domain-containing protein [Williamsia herbipolensis]|uniref:condensation domain-containing protein n=1 Tax=Williamsia herbipolensis TaxID=1603258 RepID=UPI0005F87104|nr:condensation domain-containing protein [Williamsia herbipolensis]
MEFTELADYPLPAGEVTEWIPRLIGRECADRTWSDDPRPLSYLHEEYCTRGSIARSARSDDEGHPGSWLGAVFVVPHRHDRAALGRALTTWMRTHEVFRTTVERSLDDDGPVLRRRGTDLDVEVTETSVGTLSSGTEVHHHLLGRFETLSPLHWPHCVLATITPAGADTGADHLDDLPEIGDDEFLLVFGADHSVMDAYSMLLAIGEIQGLYAAELAGTPTRPAEVGSHVDFSEQDRRRGEDLHDRHDAVRTWEAFLSREGNRFPGFPLPVTDDPVTARALTRRRNQSGMSSWVLSAEQADDINRWARASGHSMQTAVMAALAVAVRSLSGQESIRFAMPMHTRSDTRYSSSIGWFVGVVPIEIDLAGAQTLEECLTTTGAAIADRKSLAQFPFPRVAEITGIDATPRFVVSYIDARYVPESSHWSRWGARTLRGSADSDDEVYLWIVRSPKGISVSARFPGNRVATESVHGFLHRLNAVLALPVGRRARHDTVGATDVSAAG